MTRSRLMIAGALCLPFLACAAPAGAETAHNAQTQAGTSNAADSARDARAKQMQMRSELRMRRHLRRMRGRLRQH